MYILYISNQYIFALNHIKAFYFFCSSPHSRLDTGELYSTSLIMEKTLTKEVLTFQGQSKNMNQGSVAEFSESQLRTLLPEPNLQILNVLNLMTYKVKLQLI